MLTLIIAGFLFGAALQTAKLNRFDTISGLATLEDLTVAKTILLTIGISVPLFALLFVFGRIDFNIKPLLLAGIVLGGLVFGAGMAVLGYCPGTIVVSAGEGALDAMLGILGGLFGGIIFSWVYPRLLPFLGTDYGQLSVFTLVGNQAFYMFLAFLAGILLILLAFYLDKKKPLNKKWFLAGVGLALLNIVVTLKFSFNRPIGASTAYPFLADSLITLSDSSYFDKIKTPGLWELYFLFGAMLSGLTISLITKQFRFQLIFSRWEFYKGFRPAKRIVWSFGGGFVLIFGARMAGGCTSGHVVSGGMQLALSSLLFAAATFVALLIVGNIFYRKGE